MTWSELSKSCFVRPFRSGGLLFGVPVATWKLVVMLLFATGLSPSCLAQNTADSEDAPHSPHGALRRAAVLPGWGQIYNAQYFKLPILYGALGGLVVTYINLDDDYQLYKRAFQYKAFQEKVDSGQIEVNPKADFKASYERLSAEFGPISSRPLESRRDNLRRNRDLTLLSVGLLYSLSILDAFVSAHLLDFDVDDNLAIEIAPTPRGISLRVRIPIGQ